jgi:hypothetical protein
MARTMRRLENSPSGDPDASVAVARQSRHETRGRAVGARGRLISDKSIQLRVVPIQPTGLSAHPQAAVRVGQQRPDVVLRQRRRVGAIVLVDLEAVAIEPVQAILRADPDEAVAILGESARGSLGKAFRRAVGAKAQGFTGLIGLRARRHDKGQHDGAECRARMRTNR